MRATLAFLITLLPWPLKRRLLSLLFGYRLHPQSHIGLSLVLVTNLTMEEGARIGHLNVIKDLAECSLGERATIGRLNWISGFPPGHSRHFIHQPDRRPSLSLGAHSAITSRHLVDCTHSVTIGAFSTLAGFRSQILTHSIDVEKAVQSASPVTIGDYCFLGTQSVLLPGAGIPSKCVLAAGSVVTKPLGEACMLYGGVPAKAIKPLPEGLAFFNRTSGYVY